VVVQPGVATQADLVDETTLVEAMRFRANDSALVECWARLISQQKPFHLEQPTVVTVPEQAATIGVLAATVDHLDTGATGALLP